MSTFFLYIIKEGQGRKTYKNLSRETNTHFKSTVLQ